MMRGEIEALRAEAVGGSSSGEIAEISRLKEQVSSLQQSLAEAADAAASQGHGGSSSASSSGLGGTVPKIAGLRAAADAERVTIPQARALPSVHASVRATRHHARARHPPPCACALVPRTCPSHLALALHTRPSHLPAPVRMHTSPLERRSLAHPHMRRCARSSYLATRRSDLPSSLRSTLSDATRRPPPSLGSHASPLDRASAPPPAPPAPPPSPPHRSPPLPTAPHTHADARACTQVPSGVRAWFGGRAALIRLQQVRAVGRGSLPRARGACHADLGQRAEGRGPGCVVAADRAAWQRALDAPGLD